MTPEVILSLVLYSLVTNLKVGSFALLNKFSVEGPIDIFSLRWTGWLVIFSCINAAYLQCYICYGSKEWSVAKSDWGSQTEEGGTAIHVGDAYNEMEAKWRRLFALDVRKRNQKYHFWRSWKKWQVLVEMCKVLINVIRVLHSVQFYILCMLSFIWSVRSQDAMEEDRKILLPLFSIFYNLGSENDYMLLKVPT